ncbi:polysaccharide lyase family 8 super-sandwich domain-containing protein [Belliella marina]|uniref:Polysaccharide lyase family 8 super-sandwich domain-containing protein n=1 Tax=Belliella marina TaxID=1644146 RepID=A0ABW4VQT8_9BACT
MDKKLYSFLLMWIGLQLSAVGIPNSDFQTIMDRVFDNYQSSPTTTNLDANVANLLSGLQADGYWNDISYTDQSQTNWSPDTHIKRIGVLTKAYTRNSSSYFEDNDLHSKIISAMVYWTNLNPEPSSSNWWYRSISVPLEVGRILISMRKSNVGISSQLETAMISWMLKSVPITTSPGKDGSNLTDICQHFIMRACLLEDGDLLNYAVTQSSNSIFITTGEGIQRDNSFRAHGPQLYVYGYGREYLSGIRNIAVNTTGTAYAISAEKIAIISDFTRNGFIKTSRGAFADYNAFGRGISRVNATRSDVGLIEQVRNFDLEIHEDEYDLAIQAMRGQLPLNVAVSPGNTHYWRSDYSVHHRPAYMFSVNSVSTRTVKTEMGNGENIKGHYLTEGSNFIAVDGDEYFNIFPVWEWNKIPGTTIPESESYPSRTAWGNNPGKTSFVGGVSDGIYGASTFHLDDYQSKAKKSWFFFDEEVVALGAGIQSNASQNLNTTVNQTLLKGSVSISSNQQEQSLTQGSHQFPNGLDWVWHSKVGYLFPEGSNIKISNQTQTGSWSSINQTQSSASVNEEVFKLWIDHGINPNQAKYAYIVVPGLESPSQMGNYDAQNINILSNTDSIQAVQHLGLNITQVVFHKAGVLEFGGFAVKSNHPCILLLKSISPEAVQIVASDPTQTLQSGLRIGFKFPGTTSFRMSEIALPTGDNAGSCTSTAIDLNSPEYQDAIDPLKTVAIEDAFVRNGSYASTNYPTGNLVVKNDGEGWAREAFVKFDLSHLPTLLDSAILQLRVNNANATVNQTTWQFHLVEDNNWSETSLTWNNKPSSNSIIAEVQGMPAGSFVKFTIPSQILDNLEAEKKLSIRITSTTVGSTTDAQFSSREHQTPDYRPTILAYPSQIPEEDLIGVLPTDDTFIQDSDANGDAKDKNYGTAGFLASQTGGYQRVTYLKFDLGELESDPVYAQLKLYSLSSAANTNWELYLLDDNNWEEGNGNWSGNGTYGLTWNNAPTTGNLIMSQPGLQEAGYVTFDLTEILKNSEEAQIYSFRIVSTQSNTYTSFASKDAANESQKPKLEYILGEIEPEQIPEITSKAPSVLLFPNPTNDIGTVNCDKIIRAAVIKDKSGNTIKEEYGIDRNSFEINLNGLKNGLYYLTIFGDDFQITKKAIKRGQ